MVESRMCREAAPAKINLYLHLIGRRPDGYHLIDSLAVFPGAADQLSAVPAANLSLELTGAYGAGLSADGDNLVLRAAHALAQWARVHRAGPERGAHLILDKQLPIASGIGGGSADAAAALRVLARLWDLPDIGSSLLALSEGLGADVPVCLDPRPRRMRGIGERLTNAPSLPRFAMVLVNPGVPVPTASVFRARIGGFSSLAPLPDAWPDVMAMTRDLARLSNDLEAPAVTLCPVIADVLAALRQQSACLLARMSGSGATCFGIFADTAGAAGAAAQMARAGWWCWSGECRA
jgi:4-diphosphocytidyl-2-C-methyl-D-erythritol kinase